MFYIIDCTQNNMGQKEKGIFIGDENVRPFHRSYNVFISQ